MTLRWEQRKRQGEARSAGGSTSGVPSGLSHRPPLVVSSSAPPLDHSGARWEHEHRAMRAEDFVTVQPTPGQSVDWVPSYMNLAT